MHGSPNVTFLIQLKTMKTPPPHLVHSMNAFDSWSVFLESV